MTSAAIVPQGPGVFLARGAPTTYRSSLWIAVLRSGGVLGFGTAAHLWQMIDRPQQVDVIVPPTRRSYPALHERIHRIPLPDGAITTIDGLPVTVRPWSLLDYAGRLPVADAVRIVDRGLQRGWLTLSDIGRRLSENPGRTGNTVLRRVLTVSRDGAAAESERRLHALLRSAGIEGWRANHVVEVGGAIIAVLDVAFPHVRLALEVDGVAFHSDVDRFVNDRRRQNELVGLGWTVLRFTWWDISDRPEYVIATVRAHLEDRR